MKLENAQTFKFTATPGDDPQMTEAVSFASKLLEDSGLRRAKGNADTNITASLDGSLPAGAFTLSLQDRSVQIKGGDPEGVRCGLYEFMERLGARWFSPGEEPIAPRLPVSIEAGDFQEGVVIPSFPFRGLHICAGTHHYDETVARWMSFNKMNRKLTHQEELAVVGGELERFGLKPDTTVHSYSFLIPDEEFEPHREWFALVGGKRISHAEGGQLCLANMEMRAKFAENVHHFVERFPQVATIGICPNDGYGWCQCGGCLALDTAEDRAAGTVNGRVADFVLDICGRLKKSDPNVLIGNYSYSNFSDFIFKKEGFPDNLTISLTLFHCFKHALSDTACACNDVLYDRQKRIRKAIDKVYVYDYYFYNWEYLPAPFWRSVAQDFKDYHDNGLSGFLSEAPGAKSESYKSFHLDYYVAAKFLFNVETDLDALLDDYCQTRYGKAAATMREYLGVLENALGGCEGCVTKEPGDLLKFFTAETRAESGSLLKRALAEADTAAAAAFVEQELSLFGKWDTLAAERLKHCSLKSIKARPMSQLEGAEPLDEGGSLVFVNRLSLLPDGKKTLLRVFGDENHVGFKIECLEPNIDKLQLPPDNMRGADIYHYDGLEIFLASSNGKQDKCYHFLVSPKGQLAAAESSGTNWNWAWPQRAKAKASILKDRWTVAFTIPRADIGAEGKVYFSAARNYRFDTWGSDGIPDGCAYFDPSKYIEVTE